MTERDPEEEIEVLRIALAAERRKGEAFTELSHELRTLITGVLGLSALLLDTELSGEQRDYVKRIRGFSDALVGLVNNVLDFSRIEAKGIELDRVDLDLRRIVDEVGELCAERARARGVELVLSVDGDVPLLRGDPTRLRQVLLNLVSNALKFTERGEVVLRAFLDGVAMGGPERSPPVAMGGPERSPQTPPGSPGSPGSAGPAASPPAGESVVVRFEVRDTGLGISPEGQGRLFRPFSQVHAGDGGAGSGLGLALSKVLVEAMGGTIGVTSELGRGSTFHFTACLEARAPSVDRNAIPRVDMAGRRVLAAVPNAASRELVTAMMASLGLLVHGVSDGAAAVAAVREPRPARATSPARPGTSRAPFDVILLDASLPGTGELMRVLDGDEVLASVPVVLLAYPGQRWEDGGAESRSAITLGGSARLPATGRTGSRGSTRVVSGLAKPVRQGHLLACLGTLMGSAVETTAPESRRGAAAPGRRPTLDEGQRPGTIVDPARAPTSAREPPPPPAVPGMRPRILLVEDNAVNQRVARLMMEKRGYEVDVAGDGYEAVEATLRTAYAAVLMDCHMPRFDGYSATQEIRSRDAEKARVPIIAMTANAGPGARERCLAAGMDDYVAKPVSAESIDMVLRRWVSRPSAPPPAPARPSTPPPVDLGMLRKLRVTQSAGEPDIVTEVIALFLQDAPARVAGIREGVARGDLVGAARTAHTLKGSAGHLGAKTLSALCSRFEEKVRGGAPFNVSFAVSAIADELERVREALGAEREGGG